VLRELGVSKDSFVVLGCGTFDLRKGSDLFVNLAREVGRLSGDAPIHFVWLGADVGELAYWVRGDIAAGRISNKVHLVGERDAPVAFFKAANAFVLTSREDPFPCVVHEAMAAETPVIAFAGAGGASEALEGGCGIVVPYGDIAAMAEAILRLYRDPEAAMRMAKLARERVLSKYRFEDYYRAITRLAHDELGVPLAVGDDGEPALASAVSSVTPVKSEPDWERQDFLLIKHDTDFDLDFFQSPSAPRLLRDEAIELFMRTWSTASGRKPHSGFNPQIYAELAMKPQEPAKRNPFAHFIENAKPAGPWLIPLIRESACSPGATRLSTAIHVHAYYPELMEELLRCLADNASRCDLFVSTTRNADLGALRRSLASYARGDVRIDSVPNRGRDIGPFLTEYGWLSTKYDLLGHLHCKKTPQYNAEVGQNWRTFLWRNLVGGGYPMMDVIAKQFEDDPGLGLVFPDDPNLVGWKSNKECAARLAKKMGLTADLPQALEFPVGTMFWCRGAALRPLFELGLTWDDYPLEPLLFDGTILHAIERLLPFIAQHQGYRFAATHIPMVTR